MNRFVRKAQFNVHRRDVRSTTIRYAANVLGIAPHFQPPFWKGAAEIATIADASGYNVQTWFRKLDHPPYELMYIPLLFLIETYEIRAIKPRIVTVPMPLLGCCIARLLRIRICGPTELGSNASGRR